MTPSSRIKRSNDQPIRPDRDFVLYWMTANRRVDWNYSMDRAIEHAEEFGKPLIVFEGLRTGYRWASDRFHRFVIDGMADNRDRLGDTRVAYYPYVEPTEDAGKGLLAALAERACVVVTDDFPAFMLPRMTSAAADQIDVRMEAVDSNGILPMRLESKAHTRAYLFRKVLQKRLPSHLEEHPSPKALWGHALAPAEIPAEILERWPAASDELLDGGDLGALPIDHDVPPVDAHPGGRQAGLDRLEAFMGRYGSYDDDRNHPDAEATSRLSPYLHFGHVSAHEIFARVAERDGWSIDDISDSTSGSRDGWWGMSENAEGFLDELITWREIGFNMCVVHPDTYDDFESLPDWALKTLGEHADDPREHSYSLEEFENAETHDEIWNAAQNQLRVEGRIHNYLRMLWGKKILHWSESPQDALDIMIELNNKYALDGRDPNSYSGIFWVLGRYDRAWGPEREIFGKVRYMTTGSAKKKLRLNDYVERWTGQQGELFGS